MTQEDGTCPGWYSGMAGGAVVRCVLPAGHEDDYHEDANGMKFGIRRDAGQRPGLEGGHA